MIGYGFKVGLGEITPTAMNIGKSTEPVYYVYEYFIKDTNEIFYVGKGRDNRFKDSNRNDVFTRICESYKVDVRKIRTGLTEQEAFDLEEETIKSYLDSGKFLANAQIPIGYRGAYSDDNDYQYMVTPDLISSKLELHYFHNSDTWDRVSEEDLLQTYFWSDCRMRNEEYKVYFNEQLDYLPRYANELNKQIALHLQEIIENKLGKHARIFKSINAKSSKSIILPVSPSQEKLKSIREMDKKLYHLVDVLKYLNTDIEKFKFDCNVNKNTEQLIKNAI